MKALIRLLFPPRCIFCKGLIDENDNGICDICRIENVPAHHSPRVQPGSFYDGAYSALWYDGDVRKALHRFKFSGATAYAKPFAALMEQTLLERELEQLDIITYVPSNSSKTRKKGYNHSQLLAQELSKRLSVPCMPLISKVRNTEAMFGLKADRRRANVLGAFIFLDNVEIRGKIVLIADDIITTGSTLSECARVLKMAGAMRVYGAVCATPKK